MSCEGVKLFCEKLFMSHAGVFYFMNENVCPIIVPKSFAVHQFRDGGRSENLGWH